mmetsp:Transcript_43753/g.72712  ORF Transcript_43753/g.72712 Transcript_43753/m.72712 type:complete len:368 (-) Transcript_43753:298-1401(-)
MWSKIKERLGVTLRKRERSVDVEASKPSQFDLNSGKRRRGMVTTGFERSSRSAFTAVDESWHVGKWVARGADSATGDRIPAGGSRPTNEVPVAAYVQERLDSADRTAQELRSKAVAAAMRITSNAMVEARLIRQEAERAAADQRALSQLAAHRVQLEAKQMAAAIRSEAEAEALHLRVAAERLAGDIRTQSLSQMPKTPIAPAAPSFATTPMPSVAALGGPTSCAPTTVEQTGASGAYSNVSSTLGGGDAPSRLTSSNQATSPPFVFGSGTPVTPAGTAAPPAPSATPTTSTTPATPAIVPPVSNPVAPPMFGVNPTPPTPVTPVAALPSMSGLEPAGPGVGFMMGSAPPRGGGTERRFRRARRPAR